MRRPGWSALIVSLLLAASVVILGLAGLQLMAAHPNHDKDDSHSELQPLPDEVVARLRAAEQEAVDCMRAAGYVDYGTGDSVTLLDRTVVKFERGAVFVGREGARFLSTSRECHEQAGVNEILRAAGASVGPVRAEPAVPDETMLAYGECLRNEGVDVPEPFRTPAGMLFFDFDEARETDPEGFYRAIDACRDILPEPGSQ